MNVLLGQQLESALRRVECCQHAVECLASRTPPDEQACESAQTVGPAAVDGDKPETRAARRIGEEHAQLERPASLGPLEITVTPPLRSTERAAYAELGVDRLVMVPSHSLDAEGLRQWLDDEAQRSHEHLEVRR